VSPHSEVSQGGLVHQDVSIFLSRSHQWFQTSQHPGTQNLVMRLDALIIRISHSPVTTYFFLCAIRSHSPHCHIHLCTVRLHFPAVTYIFVLLDYTPPLLHKSFFVLLDLTPLLLQVALFIDFTHHLQV
jgi:hypothetical protein